MFNNQQEWDGYHHQRWQVGQNRTHPFQWLAVEISRQRKKHGNFCRLRRLECETTNGNPAGHAAATANHQQDDKHHNGRHVKWIGPHTQQPEIDESQHENHCTANRAANGVPAGPRRPGAFRRRVKRKRTNSDQNGGDQHYVPWDSQDSLQEADSLGLHHASPRISIVRCRAALAIGAAMEDPLPPCSTTTATAYRGSLTGA